MKVTRNIQAEEMTSEIPVSWVSVHHKPPSTIAAVHDHQTGFSRGRMKSLDEELLSDTQNRMNLYNFEEFNINEEDDDVFMDSVDSIVKQHQQSRLKHHNIIARTVSTPSYSSVYVLHLILCLLCVYKYSGLIFHRHGFPVTSLYKCYLKFIVGGYESSMLYWYN